MSYRKRIPFGVLMISLMLTMVLGGCGEENKPTTKKVDIPEFKLEIVNKELAKYPVSGFEYMGTNPSKADWDAKAKQFLPYIKATLKTMPEGYVIEIRGHTDSSGPEQPVGNKKGNLYWSEVRAKNVMESLIRQGIPKEKLTARGVGSSENIPDPEAKCIAPNNCRSKINRRVTFHVKQK